MKPPTNAHPLELALPGGLRAQLVPGSRPPVYTIDGVPTALDVTIPSDLVASGWCWFGTMLYQPYPERDDGPGIGIITSCYPPPRWNVALDGRILVPGFWRSCYVAARTMNILHAAHEAARQARAAMPKKAKKVVKPKPVLAPVAAPVVERVAQLVMEF